MIKKLLKIFFGNKGKGELKLLFKPKYDTSVKPFEIERIEYSFHKYSRIIKRRQCVHYKYYKSLQSANDAIRDLRRSWYDKIYRDYPANEKKYPNIKPTINIYRYRINKRNLPPKE